MRVQSGDRVAGVELGRLLGRGSTGCVYAAASGGGVVKVVPPGPAARALMTAREALRALAHPCIARVRAVEVLDDGGVAVLQEPLAEGTLRDRLVAGPVAPDEVLRVVRAIADGLAYAHGRGVVHGDLKPENVLLAGSGAGARALLTDFGALPSPEAPGEGLVPSWLAASGEVEAAAHAVSVAYMPPERAASPHAEPAGDVYALGIIAFEMLCGARPSGPGLPSARRPGVPAWADALYRRACAPLAERPRDGAALVRALDDLAPRDDPEGALDRRLRWMAAVAPGWRVRIALPDGGSRALDVPGLDRDRAVLLAPERDGASGLRVVGPAPVLAFERLLRDFDEVPAVVVPADDVWVALEVDARGGPVGSWRRLVLGRGLHAFDVVRARRVGDALVYDRHDLRADAVAAASLRDAARKGTAADDLPAGLGTAAMRAAYAALRAGVAPPPPGVLDAGPG